MYYYGDDPLSAKLLELAHKSKARIGFGAVLIKNSVVIGMGWNRRSLPGECERLGGGVDYAVHAEQAAILDALKSGYDVARSRLYVLGMVLRGKDKGKLSVRPYDADMYFSCVRCARSLERFHISVAIPLPSGWQTLSSQRALASALQFRQEKRTRVFT